MLQNIKKFDYKKYLQSLRDVRFIGLMAFCVMALLVSWSGVRVIQANYELQRKIARLQQEVAVNQLQNDNLKLKNEYYNTDQYLELQARRQFGLAAPGETVLLVPEAIALAHSVELPKEEATPPPPEQHKPFYQKNLEDWMEFFFRRN